MTAMLMLRAGLVPDLGIVKSFLTLYAGMAGRTMLWILWLQLPRCSPSGSCVSLCHVRQ